MPRCHRWFPSAALTLVAALTAQAPPPSAHGLSPEQCLALRAVRGVEFGDGFAVFTVIVPRPIADGPGGARLHAFAITDLDAAAPTPRELIGGKDSANGLAVRPGTRTVTFLKAVDGKAQVFALPVDGGEPERIADTPAVVACRWRPDGRAFAFTALDPLPALRQDNQERGFRPTVVDEDFQHLSLWLWEAAGDGAPERVRKLTEGRTVFDFAWSPDGTALALQLAPRNLVDDSYMLKRLWLLEPGAGRLRPLVDNPGKLGAMAFSPDGRQLAYISAADRNDPHDGMLYVADVATGAVRALTPGLQGKVEAIDWGAGPGPLCLLSRGVRSELCRIDAGSGAQTPLHQEKEAITAFAATADGRVALVASTARHPNELFLGRIAENKPPRLRLRRVTDGNPWLADVALGEQSVLAFAARDGVRIEGVLMLPLGHREGQRHPLVIVVHGGPEAHFSDGWLTSYSNWGQCLAARGYVVWFPNYRASTGYGVDFAKLDHGDPMGREFEDHLDAIDLLVARGLVDPDRVGIGGGSYGGYTAAWAATRHSERFAAAVSFVPFTDIHTKWMTADIPLEFFLVHYQEKWPWEQKEFLQDRSPLHHAPRCRTPLLLLGGTADPRVHPSQPFMLYRAVKFATDTPVRYVQYPGEGHGNRSNVYQLDYLLRAMRWFDHYLRGDGDRRRKAPPPLDLAYPTGG